MFLIFGSHFEFEICYKWIFTNAYTLSIILINNHSYFDFLTAISRIKIFGGFCDFLILKNGYISCFVIGRSRMFFLHKILYISDCGRKQLFKKMYFLCM